MLTGATGITLGLLIASCVNYGVRNYGGRTEYRVPIGLQFIFGVVLGVGLLFLPDSPRYYVKRGRVEKARASLASVRGQPGDSEYVEAELAVSGPQVPNILFEIIAANVVA